MAWMISITGIAQAPAEKSPMNTIDIALPKTPFSAVQ